MCWCAISACGAATCCGSPAPITPGSPPRSSSATSWPRKASTRAISVASSSSSAYGNGRSNRAARSPASCGGSARRPIGAASVSRWIPGSRLRCAGSSCSCYREGLIYRDQRLVNWDPVMHTVISDLEVDSRETKGSLWHIRYPVAEMPGRFIVVATTRPETMLGDTGVAVHPEDPRFADLVGKSVQAAADRPDHSDRRRRVRRSGDRERRGQDHAGSRFQRFRGRPAARPGDHQHLRPGRPADRRGPRALPRPRPIRRARKGRGGSHAPPGSSRRSKITR